LVKIDAIDQDHELQLSANFARDDSAPQQLETSLFRELAYCLEHSIHHEALIRIGVEYLDRGTILNEHFGVAPSTARHLNQRLATKE
jgi:hypothetical protein